MTVDSHKVCGVQLQSACKKASPLNTAGAGPERESAVWRSQEQTGPAALIAPLWLLYAIVISNPTPQNLRRRDTKCRKTLQRRNTILINSKNLLPTCKRNRTFQCIKGPCKVYQCKCSHVKKGFNFPDFVVLKHQIYIYIYIILR